MKKLVSKATGTEIFLSDGWVNPLTGKREYKIRYFGQESNWIPEEVIAALTEEVEVEVETGE